MDENEEDSYEPRANNKKDRKMTGELSRAMGRGRSTMEQ